MSRMKKSEALALGSLLGRNVKWTLADSTAVQDNLDYPERAKLFNVIAGRLFLLSNNTELLRSPYQAEAQEACVEQMHRLWQMPLAELKQKRQSWTNTLRGIKLDQAAQEIDALVKSFNIRGLRANSYGSSYEVRRGDASVTLYIRFERDGFEGMRNPDDETQRVYNYDTLVELSWSGCSRSVAQAVVEVKLYQELLEVAAEVEVVAKRMRIISTYGIPEVVEEPAAAV